MPPIKIPKAKKATPKPKIQYHPFHPTGFHTLKEFKAFLAERKGVAVESLGDDIGIYPALYKGKEYTRLRELEKAMTKYKNVATEYKGRKYKSIKEVAFAKRLELLMHAKDPKERVVKVENEVPYKLAINGVEICRYDLDFRVTYEDGHVDHFDTKGFITDVYRLKKKLMFAIHNILIIEP